MTSDTSQHVSMLFSLPSSVLKKIKQRVFTIAVSKLLKYFHEVLWRKKKKKTESKEIKGKRRQSKKQRKVNKKEREEVNDLNVHVQIYSCTEECHRQDGEQARARPMHKKLEKQIKGECFDFYIAD